MNQVCRLLCHKTARRGIVCQTGTQAIEVRSVAIDELDEQNLFASLWEAIVGTTAETLEDQDEDRVATRIPISGRVDSPDIGFVRTLGNVLRNAFLDAFIPELENSVGDKG